MGDFKDLLQEAEKLTTDIEGAAALPKVDRSLKQVLEASKELYSRVAQTGGKDIQANLLLGSKGVDLPKIAQKLEKVSSAKAFQPVSSLDAYNVKAFLANQRKNIITSVLEEDLRYCYNSLYEQSFEHMKSDWKQEKRKIISAMTAPSGAFIEIDRPRNVYIEPPTVDVGLGPEETMYAAKVHEYNATAGRSLQKIDLVQVFATAAEDFKDTKVSDMWEMLKYMTQVPPFPVGDDLVKARYSKPYVTAFVRQGKKYLEDRYKKYMSNIINENLSNAMLGGEPGTYNLVKSFVGVRLQGEYLGLQDGLIDGRPLWPMVYYCLRSGDINAALHCIATSNCADCADLIAALEGKYRHPEHGDNAKLESTVRFQYRRFIRNSTDPFKRIVWCVVGCCDTIDEHSEVARTADDYLWLKLSLVRLDYEKDDHIKFEDLQRTIVDEYGESHYDALNHPHLYFQMLILTAQFESAVEFLTRIARYNVHAVHMGIALHEMYMLLGPRDVTSPLLFVDPMDPKPVRRFNFARLIMLYVSKFEVTGIAEAIQYYFLLRSMEDADGVNLFSLCVCDLIQETGAYEKILGKIERNGVRSKGLIDNLNNLPVTAEVIAKTTAEKFVQKGIFEDAVNLYDIANVLKEQGEVLGLLCTLLSQVVQTPPQPNSLRERLQKKSEDIADRYSREGYRCPGEVATSFRVLRLLLEFFDCYHSKQFTLALKVIIDSRLVPLQSAELQECVNSFKKYNSEVWRVFPDLLLATMNILFDQYQKIRGREFVPQRFQDSAVDKQLEHLRNQAKVVANFAGTIPFRLPGDTSSKLIQMEILMH